MTKGTIPTDQISKLVEAFVNAATSVHTRIADIVIDQRELITEFSGKPPSTYVMGIVDLMVTPDFHTFLEILSSVQGKYPFNGKTVCEILSKSVGKMGGEVTFINDSFRVGTIARDVAQSLGADGVHPEDCYWGGVLHDIGKIFISSPSMPFREKIESIPIPEKMVLIRAHAPVGGLILERLISSIPLAAAFAWEHHENIFGDGYPRGLPYDEISIAGRIAYLSDVFEAIVTRRNRDPFDTLREMQNHQEVHGRDGDIVFRAFAETVKQCGETWFRAG